VMGNYAEQRLRHDERFSRSPSRPSRGASGGAAIGKATNGPGGSKDLAPPNTGEHTNGTVKNGRAKPAKTLGR